MAAYTIDVRPTSDRPSRLAATRALAGRVMPDDVVGVLLVQALAARRQRHVAEPEREHAGQLAGHAERGADLVLGDDDVAHDRDPDAERLGRQPHVLDRGPDADHLQAEAHQRTSQGRPGRGYQPRAAVAEQAAV